MKMAALILLPLALCGASAPGQSTTGKVDAHGSCNIANSGNYVTIDFKSCGIGPEQGKKIIEMLNRVLALPNSATVDAKLDELLKLASRPVTCSASILQNEGTIGIANLSENKIVCDPGVPNTMNLLHVGKPTEQGKVATPAVTGAPQKSEYIAGYIDRLEIKPGQITVQGAHMTSSNWTLLYTMLKEPKYANDVEKPIIVFEQGMKTTVSKSPATCRAELDAAEAKIRANAGHETATIAKLKSTPSTCVAPDQAGR
jgi:hypothetical protein